MHKSKEFEEWKSKKGSQRIINYMEYPKPEENAQAIYEAGQQSERDKHRWIPVTERLPDEYEVVFIKYKGCNDEIKTCAGYYAHYAPSEDEIGYGENMYIPYFDDDDDHYSMLSYYEIISWQPLPEV